MSASRGSVNSRTSKHTSSSRLRDVGVSDSGVFGASAKSYITSASELATKLEEFNAWAQKAKLDPVIKTTLPNTVIFNPIRDLQAASTTIPGWLRNLESPEFGFIPPTLLKWKDALCSTLQQSGSKYSTSHSANDDPDLPYVVNSIFRLCRNHEIARLPINANGPENEAGIRSPLDNFFMNICQIDSQRFRYHVEQKLKLPACMTSKAKVTMTKADGVLSVPIPGFGPYDLSPELRAAASAFVGTPEPPILMLVHCVVDFKFVVARWVGGKIRIYSVGTYSLRSPMSLLELYFVILGIRQLATTYEEELFQSGPNLQQAIVVKPPTNRWAPARLPTIHESAKETNNQALGGRSNFRLSLSALGKWDLNDKISAFLCSLRPCDPNSLSPIQPYDLHISDPSDTSSGSSDDDPDILQSPVDIPDSQHCRLTGAM